MRSHSIRVKLLLTVLGIMLAVFMPACGKLGDTGIYVIQANDLATDAAAFEAIVLAAELPEDKRADLIKAVNSLKLIAADSLRFEGLEDITRHDLATMYKQYLQAKSDLLFIRFLIYDDPQAWASIPAYDQQQLTDFWKRATALAGDIDAFIADPDTADYLAIASRISVYGSIVAKVLIRVAPEVIERL